MRDAPDEGLKPVSTARSVDVCCTLQGTATASADATQRGLAASPLAIRLDAHSGPQHYTVQTGDSSGSITAPLLDSAWTSLVHSLKKSPSAA